jgi:hypothetical protein
LFLFLLQSTVAHRQKPNLKADSVSNATPVARLLGTKEKTGAAMRTLESSNKGGEKEQETGQLHLTEKTAVWQVQSSGRQLQKEQIREAQFS